jgi:hypothetical protein
VKPRANDTTHADPGYCWGQKDAIALQAITQAGAAGITGAELRQLVRSSQAGVAAMMTRLRGKGHALLARREEHNRSRFFLAEHFPGKWSRPGSGVQRVDVRAKVLELVSRPCGASRTEITCALRVERRAAARLVLNELIEAGAVRECWMLSENHRRLVRVFAGPPAPGWLTGPRQVKKAQPKAVRPKPAPVAAVQLPRSAQPWQPPQPKALPEPIIPPGVKRTVAPAPLFDHRYQVDPATRVVGGFATLGMGRYLNDERRQA